MLTQNMRDMIKANNHDNDKGHVRVYKWDGSEWIPRGGDIDGEAANDNSGRSVSLSSLDANGTAGSKLYRLDQYLV